MLKARVSSAIKSVDLKQEVGPLIIGERLNTQGSKKAKELVMNDDFDGLVDLARTQVEDGAHCIDVCVATTERSDEKEFLLKLVKNLSLEIDAPLVIDSTDPHVIETVIEQIPGKPIINSINLEGDGSRYKALAPLMAKYIPWRVELQLRLEAKDSVIERKVDDDKDQDKTSLDIEHIIEWGDIETQQKSKGDLNIQEIRELTNRIGNLCLLEWNINQNIIPGWTPDEKITTGKECYVCEICRDSYYEQFNNPKIKQVQNYKFIFDIEQHNLKKKKDVCANNKCGTKFSIEHLNGYSESKIYHTSSMSTGKFVSSASIKTRENEVKNKYKFKKETTPWSEKNIINREKIYFHVLSQAFITEFDPHKVGYKIDKSKIHWKDL